jgi:hypothetical protein
MANTEVREEAQIDAIACFWISLIIFIATVTYVVAELIDDFRHPAGGDGGFVQLGEFLWVIKVHAPLGVGLAMLVNFYAMSTVRWATVLFVVELGSLGFLAWCIFQI